MAVANKRGRNVRIEVAYAATSHQQVVLSFDIPAGSTVEEVIRASGILDRFPRIDLDIDAVGIFGQPTSLEDTIRSGDRVEIYRPLAIDPKQARRHRARQASKPKGKRG